LNGLSLNTAKTRRGRDLKLGTQMRSGNISKTRKEKSRKGAWPRSRDPHKFWRTPNHVLLPASTLILPQWNLHNFKQ